MAKKVVSLASQGILDPSPLISRNTPTMAAGVTDKLWEIVDIVNMLEDREAKKNRIFASQRIVMALKMIRRCII